MKNETYNGWTNYATWRIALEFGFDNYSEFEGYDAESLRWYAEESLEGYCENQMTLSYALAFMSDVNWYEIAEKCCKRRGGAQNGNA